MCRQCWHADRQACSTCCWPRILRKPVGCCCRLRITPEANHLRVVSARFDGRQLQGVQTLYVPARKDRHPAFGRRMARSADGTLLFSMGDGNLERTDAQRLHTHLGKLLRIHSDGSVPSDNPFVTRKDALAEIYTFGHPTHRASCWWMVCHTPMSTARGAAMN